MVLLWYAATLTAVCEQVTFSQATANGVMTIHPTNPLSTIGVQYTVTMAATCVKDTATVPNAYAGLSGNTYQFAVADTTAPAVDGGGYSPAQAASDQSSTVNIVLTFDEHVVVGTGNLVLTPTAVTHSAQTAPTTLTIDVTDGAQVSTEGGCV